MKANPTAVRRLAKALLKHQIIPTKETFAGHRVHLVPVHSIERSHWHYAKGTSSYKQQQRAQTKEKKLGLNYPPYGTVKKVNDMRALVRAGRGHWLPPVYLINVYKMTRNKEKPYILGDGHHRLTAHQAEGKKFIRAVIHDS